MKNLNDVDQVIRLYVGMLFFSIYLIQPAAYLILLAAVLILTSIMKFCPLYKIFHFRTN